MQANMRDAGLSISVALPNGATVATPAAGIDAGPVTAQGNFTPSIEGEFLLEAPALSVTQLPDTKTITYDFIASDNANLSSPVLVKAAAITQLGAGGVGAIAAVSRFRPTLGSKRYFGFQATGVATVAGSTATATMTYVV